MKMCVNKREKKQKTKIVGCWMIEYFVEQRRRRRRKWRWATNNEQRSNTNTYCGQERSFESYTGHLKRISEPRLLLMYWDAVIRLRLFRSFSFSLSFWCGTICAYVCVCVFVCVWMLIVDRGYDRLHVVVIAANQLMRHGSSSSLNFWMRFG